MTPPSEQERAERRLFDGVSRASENPLDFYCTSTATGFRYLGPTGSAPIKQALSGKNSLLRMPGRAADINQRSVVGYSRNCAAAAAARQAPGSNDDCPNSNRDRLLSHTKESYTRPVAQTKLQAADSSSVASKKQPGPYSTNFSFHHMVGHQSRRTELFLLLLTTDTVMDTGPDVRSRAIDVLDSVPGAVCRRANGRWSAEEPEGLRESNFACPKQLFSPLRSQQTPLAGRRRTQEALY